MMNDRTPIVYSYVRFDRLPDYLSQIQYGKFKFCKIAAASRRIPFGAKTVINKLINNIENLIRVTHFGGQDVDSNLETIFGRNYVLQSDANDRNEIHWSTKHNAVPSWNHCAAEASILPEAHEPVTLCILQTVRVSENDDVKLSSKSKDLLFSLGNTTGMTVIYVLDSEMRGAESQIYGDSNNPAKKEKVFVYNNEKLFDELKNVLREKMNALFESLNDVLKSWKVEITRASTEVKEISKPKIIDEIDKLMNMIGDMASLLSARTLSNELTEDLKNELCRYKTSGLTAYIYCFGKLSVYVSNQTESKVTTAIRELLKPHFDRIEIISIDGDTMIKPLADIAPGSQICREGYTKSATLGFFGKYDDPSSLLAITAFHAIAKNRTAVIKVGNGLTIPLGKCIWGCEPQENRANLSDIGVIEITPTRRAQCDQRNLDREGCERSLVLNTKPSSFFETKYIFKRGGSTGLTNGYIISNTGVHYRDNQPCDIIILEGDSVEEEKPFAEEGDCGSLVVWHPTDDPSNMYALSVIVGSVETFPNIPAGSVISSRVDGAFERFQNSLEKQIHIV